MKTASALTMRDSISVAPWPVLVMEFESQVIPKGVGAYPPHPTDQHPEFELAPNAPPPTLHFMECSPRVGGWLRVPLLHEIPQCHRCQINARQPPSARRDVPRVDPGVNQNPPWTPSPFGGLYSGAKEDQHRVEGGRTTILSQKRVGHTTWKIWGFGLGVGSVYFYGKCFRLLAPLSLSVCRAPKVYVNSNKLY